MRKQDDNINNELDDLLRKHSLADKSAFEDNASLLEETVFNEELSNEPVYEK